jgi:phosphate transport system permease protein
MTDVIQLNANPARPLPNRQLPAEESARRVKQRYAVERRFRRMGFGALALTTLFLVGLLTNIIWNAWPAFSEHVAVLDVKLDASVLDPEAKKDIALLRGADYAALARTALQSAIPGIEGRKTKKELTGLLSSGAGDDLRKLVLAEPSLIGRTIKTPLLLSDDVDLYLKSVELVASAIPGTGSITSSGPSGDVTLTSTSNAFAPLAAQLAANGAAKVEASGAAVLTTDMPSQLVALNGGLVKINSVTDDSAAGTVLLPLTSAEATKAGDWQLVTYKIPESRRQVSDQEIAFIEKLKAAGSIQKNFNWRFFTSGDSREPELAGIRGALVGTALTLLVTLALCLPIGVLAAIYLEEFAPKNWLTDIVEVNINNLAAVPSIVFGLLGLSVFLNYFGLPRSAPLVGGLVLALLVLPTIIIAGRAAIKAVPPSIREAAIGLGASRQQAVFHHVLPLAMPGIMTGTIIGMAHALGETAPLLMIGMIAFIVDVPQSLSDAATVLPVQIFLWSDLPEAAFQQRTAAAIVVLLAFLFAMNGAAIWLRNKFERRW